MRPEWEDWSNYALATICWEKEYIVYLWFSLVSMLLVDG